VDLHAEAQRLVLDLVAVECSAALSGADIPHVLLKGPSTSLWLYDPPRPYRDVDLLIPLSKLDQAVRVLSESGLAEPGAGRLGEEAPHSLLLRSSRGCEVDLHVSLPTVPVDGDRPWEVLSGHVEQLDLGVGCVPVLDEAGRCLVIALHALNNGPDSAQPVEDLRLAWAQCPSERWVRAAELAEAMEAADLLEAALSIVESDREVSRRARLYAMSAPPEAFGIARLLAARRRELPGMVWREFLPSAGFMAHAEHVTSLNRRALIAAHVRRWRRLTRQLFAAVRAVRTARR